MRLELTGLRTLNLRQSGENNTPDGYRKLRVTRCAICKTDAKMWNEGHRDLIFPRVPGHELAAVDLDGARYIVWPGKSCGVCEYCISGRENLCEEMKIMGFHHDGGFADTVLAPEGSIIPVTSDVSEDLLCLAEPIGCSLNALEKLKVQAGERIIIYGGGSLGLILALICQSWSIKAVVIEKDARKIKKAIPFSENTGIYPVKDTNEADFDLAVNACPDPVAFSLCITKLRKGGRLGFFSGLKKNESLDTNLLNLAHYKELSIHGVYGLTKKQMEEALVILAHETEKLKSIIDRVIHLNQVPQVLEEILAGIALKVIIDIESSQETELNVLLEKNIMGTETASEMATADMYQSTLKQITPLSKDNLADIQFKMDNKTKPLGSLGKLEGLAIQAALVMNDLNPIIKNKRMLVFGADHGITEEGISAYPSEVTYQMVENFFNGGAAINVICANYGIDVKVVDMGVKGEFQDNPVLLKRKVAEGTQNFAITSAMTEQQAIQAIETGISLVFEAGKSEKVDILGVGEIGIGNTTSAAAIISAITGVSPAETAGRGTGLDDKGLNHKVEVLQRALDLHKLDPKNGLEVLTKVGGFELAGIVGAVLGAASQGAMVVLDGVISTAAGLVAYVISPDIKDYLISGHKSVEVAQKAALDYMGLVPVIDLDMRLGEGTGAAITMDLVETACAIMRDMASFEEAGVSTKNV